MLFTKNDYFFMRQYMAHTILSLNEVYQINKEKTNKKKNKQKKQNRFCKKVVENPWKDNGSNYISHTWSEST